MSIYKISNVIPNVWRGAEDAVFEEYKSKRLNKFAAVICLRRNLPYWWETVLKQKNEFTLHHFPTPPSYDPSCIKTIEHFFEVFENFDLPLLIFCKKGQNRTGIISALLFARFSNSIEKGIKLYLEWVDNEPREEDIIIIKKLWSCLAEDDIFSNFQ